MNNNDIRWVPIDKIILNPRNTRAHSPDKVQALAQNMRENGFISTVTIDENYKLWAGEARYKAAKLAGLKEIRALTITGWEDAKLKAQAIFDNEIALDAEYVSDYLIEDLNEIVEQGLSLESAHYTEEKLELLLMENMELDDIGEPEYEEPEDDDLTDLVFHLSVYQKNKIQAGLRNYMKNNGLLTKEEALFDLFDTMD